MRSIHTTPRRAAILAGTGALLWSYGVAQARVPAELPAGTPGVCGFSPETVRMRPTQQAPGSRGSMVLTQPTSPFGVTVDSEGHQTYDVTVRVDQLRRHATRHYVVWAATPELDQVIRLGVLGEDSQVTGPVGWNKFLAFVSEETEADVEIFSGPILLTGLSPSGRMHTMAGHGPFEDANCADFIY